MRDGGWWRAVHPGTARIIDRSFPSREEVDRTIAKYQWHGYIAMYLHVLDTEYPIFMLTTRSPSSPLTGDLTDD